MASISGQFHAYSTKCTSKRLADLDIFAGLKLRCDVQEQAHPAAFMLDDDHRIVAAEGARETDGPARRSGDGRAPCCRERQAPGANAIWRYGSETFDHRRSRGQDVGEGDARKTSGCGARACGRRRKLRQVRRNGPRLVPALGFA